MNKFRDFSLTRTGDDIVMNYRIGLCTYGELFRGGSLYSLGWNGSGYNLSPDMAVDLPGGQSIPDPELGSAFILEIGGRSLFACWDFVDAAADEADGIMTVRVSLRHREVPVDAAVCTKYDGSGCLSRWLEVTNTGEAQTPLTRLAPLSGMLEKTPDWRRLTRAGEPSPYRLGYFENTEHLHEGQFKWHPLHADAYSFGARYSRTRYRHPFFVLENRAKGTAFAGQLAYSGGYRFTFDFRPDPVDGHLAFAAELDGFNPLRLLDAGETLKTPEVLLSMVNGDLDGAVQAMHTHIRTAVMRRPHGPGCYTETAGGGTTEAAKAGIDRAAARGFDIFYIDAGWYYPAGESWAAHVGDWKPDPARHPNGMRELSDYCRSKGIKFGLWMEPERIGSLAESWAGHSDMVLRDWNGKVPGAYPDPEKGGLLDLSRPEVAAYVEEIICRMIEETGVEMFRLDFNVNYFAPWCPSAAGSGRESCDLRYNEHFAAMFDRIRDRFPNVIFENCASGGGRTDLGTVRYFDHTWVTDYPIAPRSFSITNGMTMCLPPELVDRLVTTMGAPKMASLDFSLWQLMFVRPTAHFPRETPENPLQTEPFRRFMELYNSFARPMLPTCRIWHHTPSFDDCDPKGVGILEESAPDGAKDMLGVFMLSDSNGAQQTVLFKGVDASRRYRVRSAVTDECFEVPGRELKYSGLRVTLPAALTCELFLAEAI